MKELSSIELSRFLYDLGSQLFELHKAGYAHLDVSASNIEYVSASSVYRLLPNKVNNMFSEGDTILLPGDIYRWRNPIFPPEYKYCCFKHHLYTVDPSCDIYAMLTTCCLLFITANIPNNFQIDSKFKQDFIEATTSLGEVKQDALYHLFFKCTKRDKNKRIHNAMQLLQTAEYQLLISHDN